MNRKVVTTHAFLLLVLAMSLTMGTAEVRAQAMADYTSQPPFIANTVPPNVLLLLDKSGSMGRRADCDLSTGSDFENCAEFDETMTYPGYFDSMKCYTYDSANTRFEASGLLKLSVSTTCASTLWDGNFLNWVTFRRIDAVKQALIGGSCAVARAADGSCPASGTPAKVTVKGVNKDVFPSGADVSTHSVPVGPGPKKSNGRMPASLELGATNLTFHLIGNNSALTGSFCVDDDTSEPSSNPGSCSDGDGYSETNFVIRVALDTEPIGLIQDAGSRARFGLMEFKGNDGAFVMVPIGSRQAIEWNGTTVTTFMSNMVAMIHGIEETNNEGNTPLAESLYEALRYIAQVNSSLFPTEYVYPLSYSPGVSMGSTGAGSLGAGEISALTGSETCPAGYISNACGRDPYFFGSNHTPKWASPSSQVPCCKTFILVLTDGEPTQDQTIPSALQDYAHGQHGLHCTGGSTTIHAPNGTCNTNDATPPATLLGEHRTDYGSSGSHYLDDVAYWGHINDLRQGTIPVIGEAGQDLPGFQNATIYTFFAFGRVSGREVLMHAAKLGGFNDQNSNNIPDLTEEWDKVDNNTGADGADGIPDTYFESSNGADIKDKLLSAIASILQRSGSGSAASVLATSSTGEGALYQSFFFPSVLEGLKEIKWVGYTHGLYIDAFGNLREDTTADGKMVYDEDKIVRMRFDSALNETVVDLYPDADGNGLADPVAPTTVGLRDVKGIWEAGTQLANQASSTRKLKTWVDLDNDGLVDGGEWIDFTAANASTLTPYLRPSGAPYTATNIINFIRGDQVSGLRNRQLDVGGSLKVWKLGDPIHAQPIVVGAPAQRYDLLYGDTSYTTFFAQYKNRRQVAYLGANDGMLHAFNAGYWHPGDDSGTPDIEHGCFTNSASSGCDSVISPELGKELFGFIPQQLLPHLRWLTQPEYAHVYYVDLTPKVTDVRIFTPDADHPDGWGTILIGGFRLGGSCGSCTAGTGGQPMTVTADFNYDGDTVDPNDTRTFYSAYFVLDITNPEAAGYPQLLWSFSSSDLGFTASRPSMLRVSPASSATTDNTDAKWYMIAGSGPTGYDGSIAQTGKLYAIDLAVGPGANNANVQTFDAETLNAFMSDTLTIDRDFDYRVDVSYMGSVIDDGSLPWRGKIQRMTMNACTATPCSTSTWGLLLSGNRVPTEVLDTFPTSGSIEMGPITAGVAVAIDDADKLWIFGGTGRYFSVPDKTSTEQQYFVGVKDSVLNGSCTESSKTNCQGDDLVDLSGAQVCLLGVGDCGSGTDQVTGVTGASNFPALISLVASKDGWYTTLPDTGERALSKPLVIGGLVLFPTFVPDNDPCASSGNSHMYALYYRTGSAYHTPVIGTTPSGSNKNVNRRTGIGSGMASQAVVHKGKGSSGGKTTAYVQKSSGELTAISVDTAGPVTSRFVTWYNVRN